MGEYGLGLRVREYGLGLRVGLMDSREPLDQENLPNPHGNLFGLGGGGVVRPQVLRDLKRRNAHPV